MEVETPAIETAPPPVQDVTEEETADEIVNKSPTAGI